MKIEIRFSPDVVAVPLKDDKGNLIGLSLEPNFYSRRAPARLAYISTEFPSELKRDPERNLLVVSATHGQLQLKTGTRKVLPAFLGGEEESGAEQPPNPKAR